jgi:hypothetical protein
MRGSLQPRPQHAFILRLLRKEAFIQTTYVSSNVCVSELRHTVVLMMNFNVP